MLLYSNLTMFPCSCGPGLSEKVSRRAILDRSLHYQPGAGAGAGQGEEDTWHSTAALFQDHVEEIHGKWDSIEDDIWGKVSFATSAT